MEKRTYLFRVEYAFRIFSELCNQYIFLFPTHNTCVIHSINSLLTYFYK